MATIEVVVVVVAATVPSSSHARHGIRFCVYPVHSATVLGPRLVSEVLCPGHCLLQEAFSS